MSFEKLFENMSEEQKNRLRESKSKEEFVSIVEEGDVKLTVDMLEEVAGGEDNGSSEGCRKNAALNRLFCAVYFEGGGTPANT